MAVAGFGCLSESGTKRGRHGGTSWDLGWLKPGYQRAVWQFRLASAQIGSASCIALTAAKSAAPAGLIWIVVPPASGAYTPAVPRCRLAHLLLLSPR